jgi:hypothetical protein
MLLQAQGKEHAANSVAAVIKDLFSIKKTLPIVQKWKDVGDMLSYSAAKQFPCVELVEMSDGDKQSQPQLYFNCDSMDQTESKVKTKSNEENHVPTALISQGNICLNLVGEQDDQTCELNDRSSSDKDQHKITALPSKRI